MPVDADFFVCRRMAVYLVDRNEREAAVKIRFNETLSWETLQGLRPISRSPVTRQRQE